MKMARTTNTKHGKMIVCYPALQGNGSKYTATNIADLIKKRKHGGKVALVDLDFKAPYLAGYLSGHDEVHTIDNLIERIDGGFLDEESIQDNMVELKNGVELLKGTKLKNTYHFIKQEHIRQILILLKRMYDVIVVSVSNGGESLGATVSMITGDHVVVVGRNDFSNYQSLEGELEFVKNYATDEDKVSLVFNMFDQGSDLDFQPILSEQQVPLLAWVPYDIATVNNKQVDGEGVVGKLLKSKKDQSPYDELLNHLFQTNESAWKKGE